MQIARIETFLFDPGTAKNLLFCRVETASGVHGWGEAYVTPGKETVTEHLLRDLAKYMIGRDASQIRHTAQVVFEDFAMRRTSLDLMSAWSAIEIALWDIVAKNANQPLYRILGGASRERVKVYANGWSSGTDSIEQNVERALQVKQQGYTALKWDPFPGPWRNFIHREDEDHVVRYVRLMREALGPDFTLLVEVHRRLAPMHAIRIGRRIAEYDIGWYEEPCLCDNIELVAEVRRALPMPIVTGEAIYSKEGFAQALAARAADIINPDICNCGGLSAMLDIAAMAQPHAVAIAPHNYNSTLVGLAATVQLSAMVPNFWIAECFINLKPACDEIAVTPLTVQDSFVDLPTTPGIGIDLDVARLRARPYRDMGTRMGKGLRSYTEEFPRKHYAVAATRTGY
jgi:galactonate dehydratase